MLNFLLGNVFFYSLYYVRVEKDLYNLLDIVFAGDVFEVRFGYGAVLLIRDVGIKRKKLSV